MKPARIRFLVEEREPTYYKKNLGIYFQQDVDLDGPLFERVFDSKVGERTALRRKDIKDTILSKISDLLDNWFESETGEKNGH